MLASLSSSELGPKFRVAICGAGIAGISSDRRVRPQQEAIRHTRGRIYLVPKNPSLAKYGPSAMHRQQMVAILEKALPASCTVHSRKQLVNYTEPEQQHAHLTSPIRLEFVDGTTAITDVLIGADGIRSAVRKALFEAASEDKNDGNKTYLKQYIELTFTGMTVYHCLVPVETLGKENPENLSLRDMISYHGKGKSFVTYPIAKGTIINAGAIVGDPSLTGTHYEGHWVSDATRDERFEHFDNFAWAEYCLVRDRFQLYRFHFEIANVFPNTRHSMAREQGVTYMKRPTS